MSMNRVSELWLQNDNYGYKARPQMLAEKTNVNVWQQIGATEPKVAAQQLMTQNDNFGYKARKQVREHIGQNTFYRALTLILCEDKTPVSLNTHVYTSHVQDSTSTPQACSQSHTAHHAYRLHTTHLSNPLLIGFLSCVCVCLRARALSLSFPPLPPPHTAITDPGPDLPPGQRVAADRRRAAPGRRAAAHEAERQLRLQGAPPDAGAEVCEHLPLCLDPDRRRGNIQPRYMLPTPALIYVCVCEYRGESIQSVASTRRTPTPRPTDCSSRTTTSATRRVPRCSPRSPSA
jgi:hypothetical protein